MSVNGRGGIPCLARLRRSASRAHGLQIRLIRPPRIAVYVYSCPRRQRLVSPFSRTCARNAARAFCASAVLITSRNGSSIRSTRSTLLSPSATHLKSSISPWHSMRPPSSRWSRWRTCGGRRGSPCCVAETRMRYQSGPFALLPARAIPKQPSPSKKPAAHATSSCCGSASSSIGAPTTSKTFRA